jgi:DNA polymerase-3 subunit alpha
VEHRDEARYKSIFDMAKRIDLRSANKKAFENLALAGGFDGFDAHRAQYLHQDGDGQTFLEKVLKYANKFQESENSSQVSLFGEASEVQIPEPEVPPCEEWGTMKKLKQEREVVGVYISGHPLDDFKIEMKSFTNCRVADFNELERHIGKEMTFGGIVADVQHRESKAGKGWAIFTVEDYNDSYDFKIFGEEYLKLRHFLVPNSFVYGKVYVKEGWTNRDTGKKGDPRMQYNGMQLLHDVMEKHARKLTIQMPITEVQEERIAFLETLFAAHQGNHQVHFTIYERKEKIKIQMPSRTHKIAISTPLLEELERQQVTYRLN